MRLGWAGVVALAGLCALPGAAVGQDQPLPPTSASTQIESMATVFARAVERELRPGPHRMLTRLRQLRDPELEPLFGAIAGHESHDVAAHGVLGLAQLSGGEGIDLALLSHLEDPKVRAHVILRALSEGLVSDDDVDQVLSWADLDAELAAILMAHASGRGIGYDEARARSLVESDLPIAAMVASLMLPETDGAALAETFVKEAREKGDLSTLVPIMLTVLNDAEPRVAPIGAFLGRLYDLLERQPNNREGALEAMMRLAPESGWARWREAWDAAEGLGARLRLALLALGAAETAPDGAFEPLRTSGDELIGAIGEAGDAARDPARRTESVLRLVGFGHPIATRWCAKQAESMEPGDARRVVNAVLDNALTTTAPNTRPRTEAAFRLAARELANLDGLALGAWVAARLGEDRKLLAQIALASALESDEPVVLWRGGDEPAWPDRTTEALASLVRARAGLVTEDENAPLTELISETALGYGGLDEPLRGEAAWLALRRLGQSQVGLTEVLHMLRETGP